MLILLYRQRCYSYFAYLLQNGAKKLYQFPHRFAPLLQKCLPTTPESTLYDVTFNRIQTYSVGFCRHHLRHMNASIMSVLHIPEKYAMERGGWSSDKVMKKVYTHTFSDERTEADNLIDEYFNTKIVNSSNWDLQLQEKYKSWLVLFDQDDNDTSKEKFIEFMKNATQNGT